MESTLTKVNKNQYELSVELSKEDLAEYIKRAEKEIAANVQIDGFRKGKAPNDVIKKHVGPEAILQEALDLAVQGSLSKAITEKDLEVLQVSNLEVKENSAEKLLYKVMVTLFPEVKFGDLKGIKVEQKTFDVTEEEVQNALVSIQDSRAKFEEKEGALEVGDRAEVDFEVTKEGLPIEGGVSKSHPVVIGSKNFIPGFEDNLVGMVKGDEKKFSLTAPADYFAKELAGQKLDFTVKVVAVQKIAKPELTDEFAKTLGKFEGLDALKTNLKEGISEEKKDKERQRVRLAILSEIAEKSTIEVPDEMVEQKLEDMIHTFSHDLQSKGMDLALYLAHIGKTQDDLKKDWQKDAERQVKYYLIIQRTAKDQEISSTSEEVDALANQRLQMLALYGQKPEDINIERVKEAIANELITEKTFQYLEKTYATA
jgi:trigger factor